MLNVSLYRLEEYSKEQSYLFTIQHRQDRQSVNTSKVDPSSASTMELDAFLQFFFGLVATVLTLAGLWFKFNLVRGNNYFRATRR